jgi:protein SCO1/2
MQNPFHPFAALRRLAAIALAASLVACTAGGPQFKASDITGSSFGRDFELRDPQGATRRLADFRDNVPTCAQRRSRRSPRR